MGVDEVRDQIRKLLVTGDNRLKQGVAPEKARESYEQALALAREHGLEEQVRPLVEVRLSDLDALRGGGAPPPAPPDAWRRAPRPPPGPHATDRAGRAQSRAR